MTNLVHKTRVTPGVWYGGERYTKRWPVPHVNPRVPQAPRLPSSALKIVDDPTRDGLKERFQDDCNFWYVPEDTVGGALRELARFSAPHGRIGVVRGCWQWGELRPLPSAAESSVLDREINSIYDARFFERNGVLIIWKLRLSYGVEESNLVSLPATSAAFGDGYRELPNWYENRFPWGTNTPVFWTVPENHTLRLFALVIDDVARMQSLGARLWGYTQAITKSAQVNTRHGWQW